MAFLKTKPSPPPVNLLDLKPERRYQWNRLDHRRVVVLVPKFGYPRLLRWLAPRLADSTFKINLDEFGSFVWECCDGATTVGEISKKMKAAFGAAIEPADERVGVFVQQLLRREYVAVKA